jgi:hypothetical protein
MSRQHGESFDRYPEPAQAALRTMACEAARKLGLLRGRGRDPDRAGVRTPRIRVVYRLCRRSARFSQHAYHSPAAARRGGVAHRRNTLQQTGSQPRRLLRGVPSRVQKARAAVDEPSTGTARAGSLVDAPAYFSLCKGERWNFDCNFGYQWFAFRPKRFLDREVDKLASLLPILFDLFDRGIPAEWLTRDFGYVSRHVLLGGSWYIFEKAVRERTSRSSHEAKPDSR